MSDPVIDMDLDLMLCAATGKKSKKFLKSREEESMATIAYSNAMEALTEAQVVAAQAHALSVAAEAVSQTAGAIAMAITDDMVTLDQEVKKKKKALKDEPEAIEEPADDLLDIDFSKKKKKKKKKVTEELTTIEPEEPLENLTINHNTAKPQMVQVPDFEPDIEEIPYEEMLSRIYKQIHANNPELMDRTKAKIKPPQVARLGTTRTCWSNFKDCCKSVQRTSDHVQSFFMAELGATGSIDGSEQFILKGRFMTRAIEDILKKYIDQYVRCNICTSLNTELVRDPISRLHFLKCKLCQSQRSVLHIKTGFLATTKADRKNERADD
jgi:translation initiation factor 2 subunit 2